MRGIRTLKIVSENLQSIDFPTLRRPSGRPSDPKTEELVAWGVCMYVYSLIAHMQKILAGLVTLAESGNVAATAPVARHVFEWTAMACYVTSRLKERVANQDWEGAWELLTDVALGSYWAGKFGPKYAGVPPVTLPMPIPSPVRVGKAVEEYEKYQQKQGRAAEANDSYGLLSDFSHPNAACLMRYQSWEDSGRVCRFIDPDAGPEQESFLPFVNCCLIDLLLFMYEMLGMANETTVRPRVKAVLDELATMAPAHLTTAVP
jgi:hypothetical protein